MSEFATSPATRLLSGVWAAQSLRPAHPSRFPIAPAMSVWDVPSSPSSPETAVSAGPLQPPLLARA
eukprot:2257728-Alexandrium_andersonii.AAC.1